MLDPISAQSLIKEAMPVVCSENGQFAVVDHLEGTDTIKLAKDADGQHHYIPLTWVTSVDDKVHIDRPGDQAMKDWATAPTSVGAEQSRHQNSVDASVGQPIVARVQARKTELEALLAALPGDELRVRGDINLALNTVNELLTGDLTHVPAVVCADLNRWLEHNKHVAESAVVAIAEVETKPVNLPTGQPTDPN